jgi:hypothetical protein
MIDERGRRRKVVDQVTDLLKALVPQTAGRVFRARTWNLQDDQHPALLVYGWDEEKKAASLNTSGVQYGVNLILAVEVRVLDRSRDGEEVEAELDALADRVTEAILKSPELLAPRAGLIERIESVKTSFGINTKDSEVALGRALVAFDMKFTEQYDLREPPFCVDPEIAFHIIPDPSVP